MARRFFYLLLPLSLAALFAHPAAADDDYFRVARLSHLMGHVSFQHAGDVDWSAASINLPLEPADRIYTGPDGRAEIEFDDGSVYRLAENTDIEILSLREQLIQLRILVGLSTLTVSSGLDFEINTPAAAFNATRKGAYRFNVAEDGGTEAIVRKGELIAANNQFSRNIDSGEMLRITPGASDTGQLARYDRRDEWDEWNDRRDADRRAYASRQYLPDSVYVGVSDLDRYGRWVNVSAYGYAWVPLYVDPYWSPYSLGRWCHRPYFGWTWVSYEPWGWLPYHYGRWHHNSIFGWCWLPGPGFSFNFWSPGLVTFYSGPGWVSWCPLGPGDYYNMHHYHYNRGIYGYQLSQLQALHTRRPGDLHNRDARGAFRTAGIDQFRNESFGGRNQSGRAGGVDQPWREGSLVSDRLPVEPTRASYSAAPERTISRPRTDNRLPAVVRTNPQVASGNRERFASITNPQIPALPSRSRQGDNGVAASGAGDQMGSNIRATRIPRTERTAQNLSNGNGNAAGMQSTPTATVPRGSVKRESAGGNIQQRYRSVPAAQPTAAAPSVQSGNTSSTARSGASAPSAGSRNTVPLAQQNSSAGRSERVTPAQNQNSAPPAAIRPPAESRPQNNSRAPSSSAGSNLSGSNSKGAQASEVRRATTYSAPRANIGSYWTDSGSGVARSYDMRRATTYSSPGSSAGSSWSNSRGSFARTPEARSSTMYSAPRQFNSFSGVQRSGATRSMTAPSFSRGGGSFGASSLGRSGGGSFAGRSQGGGNSRGRR